MTPKTTKQKGQRAVSKVKLGAMKRNCASPTKSKASIGFLHDPQTDLGTWTFMGEPSEQWHYNAATGAFSA